MFTTALHFLIKAVTGAIALTAACFAVVALFAHGKPGVELAHNPITRLYARTTRFEQVLIDRDARCSAGDAWRVSDDFAAVEDIRRSLRVIRTDGQFSLVQTPAGQFWMPSRDAYASAEMILDEQEGIYQPGSSGVRPGDVVLDCGANIGVYTRFALAKGARCVIAIELAPEDIESLKRNLAPEMAAGSVTVYPKGVWDKDASLQLESSPTLSSMANSVALRSDEKGPLVPLTTIDKIVDELRLERVDFIKMDIEGAEPNALRGAKETLKRFKPRLAIALEHRRTDPETLPALVKSLGPFYDMRFSACAGTGKGHLQPNVLYAQAP